MSLRDSIVAYLQGYQRNRQLGTFTVTQELPWDLDNQPLYWKNLKTIYVDTPNVRQNPLQDAFNSQGFVEQLTIVRAYFVNDAKTLPSNFDAVSNIVLSARTAPGTESYIQRTCQAVNSYRGSEILSTFEFSFRNILTN